MFGEEREVVEEERGFLEEGLEGRGESLEERGSEKEGEECGEFGNLGECRGTSLLSGKSHAGIAWTRKLKHFILKKKNTSRLHFIILY